MQVMVKHFSGSRLGGFFITLMACLLVMSFAGCSSSGGGSGSSGGTSGITASSLQGDFFVGLFAAVSDGSFWNQVNDANFDGQGGVSASIVYDSDGGTGTYNMSYTLATDGTMAFTGTDYVGIVANDATYLSNIDTVPTDDDTEILLGLSVKKSSGMSNASLDGTYKICQIRRDNERVKTSRTQFVFDGAGTVSGTVEADSDGDVAPLSGTYTVSDTGSLDLAVTGLTKDFIGQVSPDGNLIIILDQDNDDEIMLMAGLKITSGADESLLSGDYRLNGFSSDNSTTWTTMIDLTADGNGTINASVLADSEGDLDAPSEMSYTVDSSGNLAFTGMDQAGVVSSDGEMFLVVDAAEGSDGEVALLIGIKKS